MLEFIVLGQIPGTNIYLSFEAVSLVAGGLVYMALVVKLAKKIGWRAVLKRFRAKQVAINVQTI